MLGPCSYVRERTSSLCESPSIQFFGQRRDGTDLQLKGPFTVRSPTIQVGVSPEIIVLQTSVLSMIPSTPAPMWLRALFIIHVHEAGPATRLDSRRDTPK